MATSLEADLTAATATPDTQSQFELQPRGRWSEEPEFESLLPPCDGGKDAWTFLAAAFVIEIMVWGVPLLFRRPTSPMANCLQAFLGRMAYSKSIIVLRSPSLAPLVFPPSGRPQWESSTWPRLSPLLF